MALYGRHDINRRVLMRRAVFEIMVAGMIFAATLGGAIAHQVSLSHQLAALVSTTTTAA